MYSRWLRTTLAGSFVFVCAATAQAQPQNWNVEFASGISTTTGDIRSRLTKGPNIDLGAGYRFNETFELDGNFMFNGLGVSSQTLQQLKVPDGHARLISLTAGPKIHFPIASMVHGYVAGGGGWYRRTVEFTQPTVGLIDIIDPWWGYLGSAVVPANQVLGSVSENTWGANGGGGVAVELGHSGTEFFTEVRYHWAHTNPTRTTLVPITFGVRYTGPKQ
jgi:hypothetical protein